ncbi:hypothetical protein U1Q18_039546 [Sarracenia purpurea var. burkii]
MVNSKKQRSVDDRDIKRMDLAGRTNRDGFDDSTSSVELSANSGGSNDGVGSGGGLTEILSEEGVGDLLCLCSFSRLRIYGACRADERLKPFMKLNVSSGGVEYHLLAHLC